MNRPQRQLADQPDRHVRLDRREHHAVGQLTKSATRPRQDDPQHLQRRASRSTFEQAGTRTAYGARSQVRNMSCARAEPPQSPR
eukprot:3934772-Prymnesium_polylepis.1